MPRKTKMMTDFEAHERSSGRDPRQTLRGTRALLRSYREILWRAGLEEQSAEEIGALSEGQALLAHLLAPGQAISPQNQSYAQAAALMRHSLAQVARYPGNGALYYEILDNSYFKETPVTDDTLWLQLHIERSSFYQRKQEAVLLYALCCERVMGMVSQSDQL